MELHLSTAIITYKIIEDKNREGKCKDNNVRLIDGDHSILININYKLTIPAALNNCVEHIHLYRFTQGMFEEFHEPAP